MNSIEKFNQPLAQATTSSLEALQAYTLGRTTAKSSVDAIGYYKRALELDQNFALAHKYLGEAYLSRWDFTRGYQELTKAYELRDRVTERERLLIEGGFYQRVTGGLPRAVQSLTQVTQMYPTDIQGYLDLGWTYLLLGQYENAAAEYEEAHRVSPENANALSSLAKCYIALDRWQDAKSASDEAQARGPDQGVYQYTRYWLAFAQGDRAAMQQAVERAVGSPYEASLLYAEGRAAAYHGRRASGQDFLQRAVKMSGLENELGAAARYKTDAALRDAEFGYPGQARREMTEALEMSTAKEIRIAAALIFTRAGDAAKGQELAQKLNREFPADILLQSYWLPVIAAASEMQRGDPHKALDLLDPASTYEMCELMAPIPNYYAAYLRGLAYLELGQGGNAAREFQKILDHPGVVWAGITGALARLQLGRAYVMAGDRTKAKAAYQDFLTLWKDADPDIPIYRQAKAEYAKLQ